MTDIFLSYNREDQARAKLFAEAFEAQGFKVWWDVGLRTGEAYDEVTESALRTAKAVVVLWSKKSVVSRWVRAEATLADRNKTLVPCMIEPCERPIMFELTQTAELSHWQGAADDRTWLAFLADLNRFVEAAPARAIASSAVPMLAEIAAAPAPKPETLLAVLPFDNLSDDREMRFFSDGVSEDILGRIQRGSKLKVIGRTSSFQFRGSDKPKAAVALKATHVLDGSIRRAGNKARIAVSLTEAATQTTLWSEKYDLHLDDIFAVQDEISESIAAALSVMLVVEKKAQIDPAAYDLYLKARAWTPDPAKRTANIAMLEAVTHLAPSFADAWGQLALQRMMANQDLPYRERKAIQDRATIEIDRCLELDPANLIAAQVHCGLHDPFGDFLPEHAAAQTLVERSANSADTLAAISAHYERVGRNREAAAFARKARNLDPLSELTQTMYGMVLWRAGHFAEGREALEVTLQKWPDNHHVASMLLLACAVQQDWAAVDRLIDPARLAKHPLREVAGVLGLVAAIRDPTLQVRRLLWENVRRGIEATGHADAAVLVFTAHFGFVNETYELIDTVKLGPSGGKGDTLGIVAYRTYLLFQAGFPALRDDPRFVKLCARLGLVEFWFATQRWPDCADVVPYDFKAECEKYSNYSKDKFFAE